MCGVTPEQIGKGDFDKTEVMTALDIARCFGQNPFVFLEQCAKAPAWMVDLLAWYVSVSAASRREG